MWWHEAETITTADAYYTHPTKYEVLHPPGFLYLSTLSCSQLFISYLASLHFCSFSLKMPCLFCLLDFLKSQQSRCATKIEAIFYIFTSLFYNILYLLNSSFFTSVSAKFTVALGASPTCAKSTSAPYQFTAFTTCIHVTEEHLDTITIIKGAGFILSAGLDSDFTTFLEE